MSNFVFLQGIWQDVHADAIRAESYIATDPRSACFYSRRTVELLVAHLYDVMALPLPYSNDLAARLGDPAFQQQVGVGIGQKFYLLRKAGNAAVHDTRPIRPDIAQAALRELHHVLIWAAFNYSTQPDAVPKNAAFDTKLTVAPAPRLTREQVADLNAKLQARDEAHAKQLAERDGKAAQLEAELVELRAAVAAAQAAKSTVDDRDYNEAETRRTYIDVDLAEAGWPLTAERDREYKVEGLAGGDGVGYIDYVLWGSDDLPLAIIEAKRTSSSPQVGQQQAKYYADALEAKTGRRPVIFMSNGYTHTIWDDAAGYPPREIQGFYTRDELELMVQRRRTRFPLADAPINSEIVERIYQQAAIKAVGDAFDRKQRAALLVMATGTGKTRVAIALIDQLMNRGWVRNVLFLADRTALVKQAANNFKTHLPSVTAVNLLEDRHGTGRVMVSTYPTMMGMIGSPEDGGRRFGPGHFDLIVIDEAHRSIYQKYGAIFSWFDALRVGLTATPKDEVDHNTYRLFHLEDGIPTYAYDLKTAVTQEHLVAPRGVAVGTKFMRDGIKYADLSEDEKDEWDSLEWGDGDIPDAVDPAALNQFLFNEDTVDKVLATLMRDGIKVAGGDRLGRTIIFAKSQQHAEFIRERFDAQYPEYGGTFARVITHAIVGADKLIDDFSVADHEPHIAISVDMLDTGIDVPEVVNLVFFKLVRSSSKFWQMIGRGTRLRPDLFGPEIDKTEFLVFDFCGNLEFFGSGETGSEGSTQKSLTQRLFEGRVALVAALDRTDGDRDLRTSTTGWLARVVGGMNRDNALVRPHRQQVEEFASASRWQKLDPREVADVATALGGLPSAERDTDETAKRFDLLILTRQLAQLEADRLTAERIREKVQEIASALLTATSIPSVAEQQSLLDDVAGDDWWIDVTLPMLELARLRLRGLVRFVPAGKRVVVYTDFEDELGTAVAVDLVRPTPGTDWARFRQKATAYLREHEDHVSLQRLRRNRQLTAMDVDSLEQMLIDAGIAQRGDIARAADESNGFGLFIRSLVGLDRSAATEAFGDYLDEVRFTIDQVRFIGLIVDELTRNGVMEPSRLFESPFTDRAPIGPSQLFSDDQVDDIVHILGEVKGRAGVA